MIWPALAVKVCLMAEPSNAVPRAPGARPRKLSRADAGTASVPDKLLKSPLCEALLRNAWKLPWVGALPMAEPTTKASPVVCQPLKLPDSKPPLMMGAAAVGRARASRRVRPKRVRDTRVMVVVLLEGSLRRHEQPTKGGCRLIKPELLSTSRGDKV